MYRRTAATTSAHGHYRTCQGLGLLVGSLRETTATVNASLAGATIATAAAAAYFTVTPLLSPASTPRPSHTPTVAAAAEVLLRTSVRM